MDTQQLIAQMLDEEVQANTNAFNLGKHLDVLVIALEDETGIEPSMLQVVEQDIKAMQAQAARLQELFTTMQQGEVTHG